MRATNHSSSSAGDLMEKIERWKASLDIAFDQLSESYPKSISAAASVIAQFLDRFAKHPEIVDALLGAHKADVICRLLEAARIENPYVQSAALGALARLGC